VKGGRTARTTPEGEVQAQIRLLLKEQATAQQQQADAFHASAQSLSVVLYAELASHHTSDSNHVKADEYEVLARWAVRGDGEQHAAKEVVDILTVDNSRCVRPFTHKFVQPGSWNGMHLTDHYVKPFKVYIGYSGVITLNAELPQELSCVHDTFHVSNLKKCLAEPDVQVPLDEIEIDENLRFVEEPIEIVERDVKKLKRRRIPLVKVRWNSRQGAEYTWEHEDQFRKKYPHLFSETVPPSGVAT
ncbi:putative reverse transcriptase domain-containing protein, partial [Tanacetum coccineum]